MADAASVDVWMVVIVYYPGAPCVRAANTLGEGVGSLRGLAELSSA